MDSSLCIFVYVSARNHRSGQCICIYYSVATATVFAAHAMESQVKIELAVAA